MARKKVGNFESIFSGDFDLGDFQNPAANTASPPPDVLRALLQTTAAHIWSTTGDVVLTDGNLLGTTARDWVRIVGKPEVMARSVS